MDHELTQAAEEIFNGWHSNEKRINWSDFLDRVEAQTGQDLGSDMNSPLIKEIKAHIRAYRKLGN